MDAQARMTDLTELYTWTEVDPETGEGTICIILKGLEHLGPVTLQARKREIADEMGKVAELHHRRTGHKVRLVRWTAREDLVTLA
jgi:hypothetical protein